MRTLGRKIVQAVKMGREANTRARDLATGRAFLRHGSHSDDSARQLQRHREEKKRGRAEQLELLERIARKLEQREGGKR